MSVVPSIFNGMNGRMAIDTVRELPSFGFTNGGLSKPTLKLNWKTTNNLENMTSLRQSVLLTNQGGTRGTLPCRGAASAGMAWVLVSMLA